jgi:hypothetical protein
MWTLDQALTNWRNAFDSGHLTAARAWWSIVHDLMCEKEAHSLPAEVAAFSYPAFGRFCEQAEALELPPVAIDLGARLADELIAHYEVTNTPEKVARLIMALA